MNKLNKKIVLLIRKWLRIENEEHHHWCSTENNCYHRSVFLLCAGVGAK